MDPSQSCVFQTWKVLPLYSLRVPSRDHANAPLSFSNKAINPLSSFLGNLASTLRFSFRTQDCSLALLLRWQRPTCHFHLHLLPSWLVIHPLGLTKRGWVFIVCRLHPAMFILAAAYKTLDEEAAQRRSLYSDSKVLKLRSMVSNFYVWCKGKLNSL